MLRIVVLWAWICALSHAEDAGRPTQTSQPALRSIMHWAFQPIGRPTPPAVKDTRWPANPIDAFILSSLEDRGWHPAPPAERARLIRRLSFDLLGLPPSPEAVREFVSDPAPDAYERLVDRYLSLPQMGERWAQHWLDVVRFAETEGFEYDGHLPDAWRYRDFVIHAFNRDMPFNQFVLEQLAGDERADASLESQAAAIFHRLGPVRRNAGNPEIALSRNEVLTERTDVIGAAFLGLTLGCARCHNHKFDPITQKDYYQIQAYLAATQDHSIPLASLPERQAWEAQAKPIQERIKDLQKKADATEGAERVRLRTEAANLEAQVPAPLPSLPGIRNNPAQRTAIHVLKRGVWENKGEAVTPGPPAVLTRDGAETLPADVANPRTHLGQWLVDPANPLTARVIVNRLWTHHFGAGLVRTPNDFGIKGAPPTHPELLDWLASRLVDGGWKLKAIHRLMLLSATYQQSVASPDQPEADAADPENRLLRRFNRRRLSAEEIRDAMLAAAGRLNTSIGGASIMIAVDPELTKLLYKPTQWTVTRDPSEHHRRSIYLIAKRNLRLPFMEVFDQPALLTSTGRRESSTHAPQALEMMNGAIANSLASDFALRLGGHGGRPPAEQADLAFWLALGRAPTAAELERSIAFLSQHPVTEFTLALFNLNAFLYVD